MSVLSFARVTDELAAVSWRRVHNEIIPTDPLTLEQVVARSTAYVLDLATLDRRVVGCSTLRPATEDDPVTVIVRILPEFRRQGLGSSFLVHAARRAREMAADRIQTIVLASNTDGLEFALHRGFVETESYTIDSDATYVHLATSLDDLDQRPR